MNDLNKRFIEFYNYLILQKTVKSAKEFAETIEVSSSLITEIMKKRSIVGTKAIQNSVIKLNLNSDWLFTGLGEMIKNGSSFPIYSVDNSSIGAVLERYEALVIENAELKKDKSELTDQLNKKENTVIYKMADDNKPDQLVADKKPE